MESTDKYEKAITLQRAINGLQSTEKSIVRQSITEISEIVSKSDVSQKALLYERLEKPLVNCLQGNVESCREKAIALLTDFIQHLDTNKSYLTLLIPALHSRIGTHHSNETSEEIRLSSFNLLDSIIEKYADYLGPYMEDIVDMVSNGIKDTAPLVKRTSCKVAVSLSSLTARDFYPHTKHLIQPLRECITHQHWRVRVAVIEAIGCVMQYGDSKLLYPETTNVLAKRLFDDTPNVRLAIVKVTGTWLLQLRDRYSFFPHLLPHILTSLVDSNDEVKRTAAKYWDLIGDQYLKENENDYKDEIDLGKKTLNHYPPDVDRPKLGCRCLVQREAYKFLAAISSELSDWLVHVKIKSAQLLSQVILHSESRITHHVNKVIPAMAKTAADSDPPVAYYVKLSAYYMGHFVPVSAYINLIVEHITDTPSCGELEMVGALISGSQAAQLVPHLNSIVHLISNSTSKSAEQMAINNLVRSIVTVCKTQCTVIGNELWAAIIMNYSLADSDVVSQHSIDTLSLFASVHDGLSKKQVNIRYCKHLLQKLVDTNIWTVHCHQQFIFDGAVNIAGEIVEENVDDLLTILKKSTSEDSDPEVILKMILTCHVLIQEHDVTLPCEQAVRHFIQPLINEVLLKQLAWRPGRSAEALRSGACLTLCTALSLHIPHDIHQLIPVVLSLAEDAAPKTRLLALRSLVLLAVPLSSDQDNFSKTIHVLVKRLDDCDKGVRELSINAIKTYFKTVRSQGDEQSLSKTLLEYLISTLLIHLDDEDKSVQTLVLDCLNSLADFDLELLRNKMKNETFRDKNIQEALLKSLDAKLADKNEANVEKRFENICVRS